MKESSVCALVRRVAGSTKVGRGAGRPHCSELALKTARCAFVPDATSTVSMNWLSRKAGLAGSLLELSAPDVWWSRFPCR